MTKRYRGSCSDAMWINYSGDGSKMAIRDSDMAVRVFKTEKSIEAVPGEFAVAGDSILQPILSFDGSELISCNSSSGVAKLWIVEGKREIATFDCRLFHAGQDVCFSPNDIRAALGSVDGYVYIYSTVTGEEIKRHQCCKYPIQSVSYSPDGGRIVTSLGDGTVKVWKIL